MCGLNHRGLFTARVFGLMLFVILTSCEDTLVPVSEPVHLLSTRPQYGQIDTIQFSISNALPDTIWWASCSGFIELELQILTTNGWARYYRGPEDCLIFTEYLAPGQDRAYTIDPFLPFVPGQYRINHLYSLSRPGRPDFGDPDTPLTAYSNVFRVYGIQFKTSRTENGNGLVVESEIKNPLSREMYLLPCVESNVRLERYYAGGWDEVETNHILVCEGDSIVSPGETISKTFRFADRVPPGAYRIGITCHIPGFESYDVFSNEFKVHFSWTQP